MASPTPTFRHTPLRGLWPDQWLLDAARRAGEPIADAAAGRVAGSAWEAMEGLGMPATRLLELAIATSAAPRAELAGVGLEQARLLSRDVAERYLVVAVALRDEVLEIATANPLRLGLEQELAFACGRRVQLAVATPAEIRAAQERVYPADVAKLDPMRPSAFLQLPGSGTGDESSEAVMLTDRVMAEGLNRGASDVHLEPTARGPLKVRIRIDGVLHDALDIRQDLAPYVVSRLKVSAGLDVADRVRPQDGRASITWHGRNIDLRVSTLPLGGIGEKVVIRILDGSVAELGLDQLGFMRGELARLHRALAMPEGLVLVTGPTGSGKTTTLYSALRHVQTTEKNIVTVEDPIEYRLAGINQVQTNDRAGLTFAAALRSILRQDPDVVLVGEIRDKETADIGIKAAMTGHLVLSTLHTNDAASAIARLLDIGVEPGAVAGALKAVVAQRLIRRVCPDCSEPLPESDLPADHRIILGARRLDRLRRAVGCATCRGTGYRGRMVVAELMMVTPELQRAVARAADPRELTDLAAAAGTVSLWEAGLARVADGSTTLHELLDNLAAPVESSETPQSDIDALLSSILGGAPSPAPARPPAPAPMPEPARPPRHGGSIGAIPLAAGGSLRVLVVHDDREARQQLRRALEDAGHRVIEAADGEAGLSYASRLAPDLVVTELALPRLDGIALVQALALMPTPVRVVVRTTQADDALLAWAREVGAAEVLSADAPVAALVAPARAAARRAG